VIEQIPARRWAAACDVLLGGIASGRSFEDARMDVDVKGW
jgi:hypothetical protein